MEPLSVSISVDLVLIGRCLAALLWGIGWACFIQFHRLGQFWVAERTWLTVFIGIGVDLAIAFNATWGETCLVIAASSIAIILRSLINESKGKPPKGYKVLWGIEDALALSTKQIEALRDIASSVENGPQLTKVSRATTLAHLTKEVLVKARRGDYEKTAEVKEVPTA